MTQLPPTSPRTWPVRGRALRRAPVVLVLIAVVLLAWAGPAAATTTDHYTIPITYGNSFTCPDGHAVDVTRDGVLRVTLYRNRSGTVRRELDQFRFHYEFHSPDTGKGWSSFMHKDDLYSYYAGSDIGDPVILTSVGSGAQHVPGYGSDYGIQVFAGTIVGYSDDSDVPFDDVPNVEINEGPPLFSAGHHPDIDFCATTI